MKNYPGTRVVSALVILFCVSSTASAGNRKVAQSGTGGDIGNGGGPSILSDDVALECSGQSAETGSGASVDPAYIRAYLRVRVLEGKLTGTEGPLVDRLFAPVMVGPLLTGAETIALTPVSSEPFNVDAAKIGFVGSHGQSLTLKRPHAPHLVGRYRYTAEVDGGKLLGITSVKLLCDRVPQK